MSNFKYDLLKGKMTKIADVQFAAAVLEWDQETYMPEKGAIIRGQQLSTLASIAHDMKTEGELYELVRELSQSLELNKEALKNVCLIKEDIEKEQRLPKEFVTQLSLATSQSFHAWQKAKEKRDFNLFAPFLSEMVELKRREATYLGYEKHPYNALLHEFEPGATVDFLDNLFENVKQKLIPILAQIKAKKVEKENFFKQDYPKESLWNLSNYFLILMGYDFEAGRQDYSAHPFTTSFGSNDVRVTTRYTKGEFADLLLSTIHEGGHALYEQGLLAENYGLPAGSATSLGIHESQSRLWENNIGRSLAFWEGVLPKVKEIFPNTFDDKGAIDFFEAVNEVKPSLIRTQADELTYHFHILIRYEIEKQLINNEIEVNDLPRIWNEKYKDYLGVDVPSDDLGVLQDVHWAHGGFGYFPTYSLGSFYAAQFFATAQKELSGLDNQIKETNFISLKKWLNDNIHQFGRLLSGDEICVKLTGESLNIDYFMQYIKEKHGV